MNSRTGTVTPLGTTPAKAAADLGLKWRSSHESVGWLTWDAVLDLAVSAYWEHRIRGAA